MGSQTKTYKRTLSGSIGAGMGSLFAPGGKKYYILEHKINGGYHRAGESQEIIVDNIELGRDSHCQVRFDERFKTVSRRHAAIVREGDMWKLVPISKNATLLNGRALKQEWYLQNGDEIQLSVNGPKLGFIVPTGKKSTVGSIGLTRRLSLFRQQALRPYKTAITVLSCFLVLAVGGGTFALFQQKGTIDRLTADLVDNTKALEEAKKANVAMLDTLGKREREMTEYKKGMEARMAKMNEKMKAQEKKWKEAAKSGTSDVDMTSCHPFVYFIQAKAYIDGKEASAWLGTGFQLNDGNFITARHVTTPYYSNNYRIIEGRVQVFQGVNPLDVYMDLILNIAFQAGRAEIHYECTSTNKTFKFTSKQVNELGKYDIVHELQEPFQIKQNGTVVAEIPAGTRIREGAMGFVDFAYCQNGIKEGLKANRDLSVELKQGTQLYILGYPHGLGQGNPILSTARCAQNGLNEELGGIILVSNNNTEGGNSGGPIFVKSEKDWEVVAIVSGRNYEKGRFVPIAVIP